MHFNAIDIHRVIEKIGAWYLHRGEVKGDKPNESDRVKKQNRAYNLVVPIIFWWGVGFRGK